MNTKLSGFLAITATLTLTSSAFTYDFWGITVGSASYEGSIHTTFDGVSDSGAQYVVGGWKYTCVDGTWSDPSEAPTPGEGYLASRRSDAQGIFFKPDAYAANFVIIATSAQTGQGAPELGYEERLYGPGDLKIDVGNVTLGVGLRLDDLLWAQDPTSTQAQYQLYGVNNEVLDMNSRDAGTLGDVEINPLWGRVGNQDLAAGSDRGYAFYVSGTGTFAGSAVVDYADTGIAYNGAHVYAYSVSVPWEVLGQNLSDYSVTASWRPDCGNDILSLDLAPATAGVASVPEPGSIVALASGLAGLAAIKKRY